jgi:ribose transport system substrate-binding protein
MKISFVAGSVGLSLFAAICGFGGCGAETGADNGYADTEGDTSLQEAWLVRTEMPDSPFVPVDLEDALDNLASALNETEPDLDIKLSFIQKDLTDYWKVTLLGAYASVAELGIVGNVSAPNPLDDEDLVVQEQIDLVYQSIGSEFNGVGLAPLTSDLIPAIESAAEMGLVVVTFDSDEADSKRHFYVGTNNLEAGRKGGETLVNLIGENNLGTVIVYGDHDDPEWVDGYERTHAAADVLSAAGYTVVPVQDNWSYDDGDLDVLKTALETADPKAVGMIGMFSNAYVCADAAVAAGVIDDIKIAAFDFDLKTIQYMENGQIQATHTQRQYYMGLLVPYILYSSIVMGVDETKNLILEIMESDGIIDTGLDVVTADRLGEYNDYLDMMGIAK